MDVLKNNLQIALFMGGKIVDKNLIFIPGNGLHRIDTVSNEPILKYHISWDWLMPVIAKAWKDEAYPKYIMLSSTPFDDGGIDINPSNILATYESTCDFMAFLDKYRYTDKGGISVEMLKEMAKHEDADVRAIAARHKDLPQKNLIELSRDDDTQVRIGIAYRKDIPENIAMKLATDTDWLVRESIARNRNVPAGVLDMLANSYASLRRIVAGNPNTPINTLVALATDESWAVRCAVAGNPNTPINTLVALATDKQFYVKQAALRRI